jgi:outer membrane protein
MKKLVLLTACGLFLGTSVFAQKAKPAASAAKSETTTSEAVEAAPHAGLKLGWLNSAMLLDAMPDKNKADSAIAKYAKSFQDLIEGMAKEYQSKIQEYQANEKTMTDAVKEVRQKEIQDLQNRAESTQQSAQEKIGQKKQEVYGPILDKADKAIKAVAKEKGYDYIFDASSGGGTLLFARESDNITPFVKEKLGIK